MVKGYSCHGFHLTFFCSSVVKLILKYFSKINVFFQNIHLEELDENLHSYHSALL